MNCSVARALDVLGDWWTLLVVREAFLGTARFADFEQRLGIAKNILAERLKHLVEHDVLERVDVGRKGRRFEYRLTEKGKDLLTILTALRQWGDRWVFGKGKEPVVVRDRRNRRLVPELRVTDASGNLVGFRDLVMEPGPGASRETRQRFLARRRVKAKGRAAPSGSGMETRPPERRRRTRGPVKRSAARASITRPAR